MKRLADIGFGLKGSACVAGRGAIVAEILKQLDARMRTPVTLGLNSIRFTIGYSVALSAISSRVTPAYS